MRGGKLRHRVSIQEEIATPDGMGGEELTWSAVSGLDSVPAALWPISSKERLETMKLESIMTHKIRIRYVSDITSKNRILFGTRIFNIIGAPIDYEERHKYLDIMTSEKV